LQVTDFSEIIGIFPKNPPLLSLIENVFFYGFLQNVPDEKQG